MRPRLLATFSALLISITCLRSVAAAPNPIVITGDPVGPPLTVAGTGLCVANVLWPNADSDFPLQSPASYKDRVNGYLDANVKDWVTSTLRTVFDLSNNNVTGLMFSNGDFTGAMTNLCKPGGCDFFINDTTTEFASRFRGFLNITQSMAGSQLHFGFFADDSVSLTIFDSKQNQYPAVTRAIKTGAAAWRTTNAVTFMKPGIYPIEILYVQLVDDAALEMSVLNGAFTDIEVSAKMMGSGNLKTSGFSLFEPAQFYQTDDGQPPFADLAKCSQCNRQFANLPGNGGCGPGLYCNEAALCAPCNTALFCGTSCSPCGGSTPFCVNGAKGNLCVSCRDSKDCKPGLRCDPDTHECNDCNVDDDCERGKICNAHKCVPCGTVEHCAGASCNCCPGGMKMQCASLTKDGPPVCVECLSDKDCSNTHQRCDTINGRCVDQVAACNTSDKCGASCVRCPTDRPLCLDGKVCVECRADTDCGAGTFCLSGECSPCAIDRHCGTRCASCGGDAPVCLSLDGTAARSGCVRCRNDGDCASGSCDVSTHNCIGPGCGITCPTGTLCDGKRCVTCYANTHCPCGGSCDVASGTCAANCTDSADCGATSHCTSLDKTCQPGRRKPDTQPEGTGPCSCLSRIGGARACTGGADTTGEGLLFLSMVFATGALVTRRRRRG